MTRFSKSVVDWIPNFEGAEKAVERLINWSEFQKARVVKVNPDSPQTNVRRGVLLKDKRLIMSSPRLRKDFMLLGSAEILRRLRKH